jgi:hypothetical protein
MLTTTVNLPTRRAPSPQIRARDTLNDGAANGSAGVNSARDVDAGANGAPDLGGQRCRDHEDRGDNTNYRKLAEHDLSLPWAQKTELPLGRVYQLVHPRASARTIAAMAAMNKCLAQSNKSNGGKATKPPSGSGIEPAMENRAVLKDRQAETSK